MIPEKIPEEKIRRILDLRAEGLTQEEIAEAVEISRSTVARYLGKQKKKLGSKLNRFLTVPELQDLCEILVPLMREKLQEGNPDGSQDEGQNKENDGKEEEMSNGDVESKAQEIADRREMLKRMEKMEQWGKDMEVLKSQVGKAPAEIIQEINDLKAGMEGIRKDTKDTKDFCAKFPEFCATQEKIQKQIDKIESDARSPKGIGFAGHQTEHPTMEEFFTCCDSDEEGSCSTPKLCGRIPASLKAKMLRHFCKDEACVKELEKQGFQLDGEGYREKYKGFLGG